MPPKHYVHVSKPMAAADIGKLIDKAVPAPQSGESRSMWLVYRWAPEKSGWFVISLQLYNSPPWNYHTGENMMNEEDLVFVLRPGDEEIETATVNDSPVLTWSGKRKVYKTLEYLRRDMTKIAGAARSKVILMEYVDELPDEHEPPT